MTENGFKNFEMRALFVLHDAKTGLAHHDLAGCGPGKAVSLAPQQHSFFETLVPVES